MSSPSTPRSCTIAHPSPVQVAVCGAIGTVGTLSVHALINSGVNLALRAGCERAMMASDAVRLYEGLAVRVMELDYADERSVEAVLDGVESAFLILPWARGTPAMMAAFLRSAPALRRPLHPQDEHPHDHTRPRTGAAADRSRCQRTARSQHSTAQHSVKRPAA